MTQDFKFECWEIEFPDDPDGEDSRGITEKQANAMLRLELIAVRYEGIVRNSYDEAVYSHSYVPTEGNEGAVWEAWADELYENEEPDGNDR